MISVKNVSCSFNGKNILEDISLEIENHLTILGANGSGKSTLAKAISKETLFDGQIFLNHTNIRDISLIEKAKLISYIPAKLDIYDTLISVEEFVLLGRFPYKEKFFNYSNRDRKITKKTLILLKISHLSSHSVRSLSSGEQQLVLIAQALAQQSKIIIFDEPTANLDPNNSKIIAQHIKGLKEYHQIILITHDLHLADFINSPIAFIKDKKSHYYYKDDFFKDEILEELYDVAFNALVLDYD